ncbi:MAG TPA: hypothetical protein VFL80_02760, partial [Thermoanaerobaculia bacterium]|nr:hypothetical protein [Thermoanaerobaculia bacterium]
MRGARTRAAHRRPEWFRLGVSLAAATATPTPRVRRGSARIETAFRYANPVFHCSLRFPIYRD